jgi:hypothetical protein
MKTGSHRGRVSTSKTLCFMCKQEMLGMGVVSELLKDVEIPRMAKVRQIFARDRLDSVPDALRSELFKEEIKNTVRPGMQIAITGGSRGIADIAVILKEIASFVKERGAHPFIIPAMGSHGGATVAGQVEVLESYGITEEYCGCPIKATMETRRIGFVAGQKPVFIDKYAAAADGIIVVNRIKPHTSFRGTYESGLMKMLAVGLGKQKGAGLFHATGFKNAAGFIPLYGNVILANSNVLFGVAILENPYDEACKITALTRDQIPEQEPALLAVAKALMPRIWFTEIDVLIVDQIGKNISGDGMDPNITGTFATPYASGGVRAQRVAVLDLSEETHGNAIGMGAADFSTRRLFEKVDLEKTYPNGLTSTVVSIMKIPVILNSDREAIQAAIKTCTEIGPTGPAIVRIKNSLHLDCIYISEALLDQAGRMQNVEVLEEPRPLVFNEQGNLW